MKISARTQYACKAMIELAQFYESSQLVRIKSISEEHDISSRFLVQILLQLKTAGLVHSARGASGGYQLARPPKDITLADILNAVEDRAEPQSNPEDQPINILLNHVWKEVQAEEEKLLQKHTLADMIQLLNQPNGLSYQI